MKHRLHILPVLALLATPALADVKAGVDAWTKGDFTAAVQQWQEAAGRGDPDAQFNLAQAYKLGRGVKQDAAKAEELFGKAAAQGHIQASDNYGLLLFQRGQRAQALPYVRAAADRGDPRAQYLLGIANFNGDNVPKDWVRAYALVSLAQQAGLPQAAPALSQMDQYIPLEQRQASVALASELSSQAEATRARQLASADLGNTAPAPPATPPTTAMRAPVVTAAKPPAATPPSDNTWRSAGADYARPQTPIAPTRPAVVTPPKPAIAAVPRPIAVPAVAARPAPAPAAVAPRPAATPAPAGGGWRIQLGAFGVPGNAEAQWNRVKARPELAGHGKILAASGSVTRLLAGGFASQGDAQSACSRLSGAGVSCIVVRN